jgi:ectoine hydroxylase-related dioxygenase (phytanoyl-CoA dioxygenase family)
MTLGNLAAQELSNAFDRDGAVCIRQAFSPQWLETLERGVEANLASPGPNAKDYTSNGAPGRFFGDYCNWTRIPEYRDFLFNSPAPAIAGVLMRSSKVNLFHEHVLVKELGTQAPTPWHHDQPYWTVDGSHCCSIWLSLDPVSRDAAVQFVAGSHRWGRWFRPRKFADSTDHVAPEFEPVPEIDANRYSLLGWDLAPGDCVVFHGLTLHGAAAVPMVNRRRAFSSRWTGDDARFVLRGGIMSPPPPAEGGPKPGSPMDSQAFPVVWRADSTTATVSGGSK